MSDRSLLRHLEERGFSGVGKVALKRMLPYLKLPNEKTYLVVPCRQSGR